MSYVAAPSWQAWQRLEIDNSDNIGLVAFVDTTVDLGGGPLTLNGVGLSGEGSELALVVAKLDPCGEHLWSKLIDDGAGMTSGALFSSFPGFAIDAASHSWVATGFMGAVTVDQTLLLTSSATNRDVLLVELAE